MNHSKIVREIFGKDMEAAGYTYIKGIPNHYPYVKEKGDVKLEIAIDKSRFITEVRMLFRSNAYGQRSKELWEFVPGVEQKFWWWYSTEEEFRAVIAQFHEWTMEYGLGLLEGMSAPTTEARPKPETNRYLYEHHEELNRKYLAELGMEGADTAKITYAVQEKVNELRGKPFEEVEETLIGLAAVYGHYMCLYGIGRWEWVEEYQRCDVCDLGGTKYGIAPLDDIIVIYHCEPDDIDDFIEEYANLLHDRNEAIEYGDIEGEIIDVEAAVAKAYE